MSNTQFPSYRVPKGIFNKEPYNTSSMTDPRTQNMQFMGELQPQNTGQDNIHPITLPVSRQINELFGEPYTIAGSNSNNYSNKGILPNFQLDMLSDELAHMSRGLGKNRQVKDRIKRLEITADNEIKPEDILGENAGMIPKKIHEYEKPNFRDDNYISTDEFISEEIIHINSSDRDCLTFPNPFSYRVEFNPVSGTNNAYISKVFENVKFIELKNVIVPRKYYVLTKPITMTITGAGTVPTFVGLFTAATEGSPVVVFQKYIGSFVYDGITYYFVYYRQNTDYYFSNNEIFINDTLTNKVQAQIGPGSNQAIIFAYINAFALVGYTFNAPTLDTTNSWVLIDHNSDDRKIKFSYQDTVYDNVIDQTFEFTYDVFNNIVANSFKEYVLGNGSLENNRFLLLKIPELESRFEYSTDQSISKSFSIMFPNYTNGDYYYLDSSCHEKIYDRGVNGIINKMSISYTTSIGDNIKASSTNIIDYDITTPKNACICTYDDTTGERVRNYQCMHSYLRHQGYEKLQNILAFKVGSIKGRHNNRNIQ